MVYKAYTKYIFLFCMIDMQLVTDTAFSCDYEITNTYYNLYLFYY